MVMHAATDPHATVHWAGETLHLLPSHAVWWPACETLFIADLHLGKAASFRAQGQPVPTGTTRDNLARLEQLVRHHPSSRLVILGDFLHAASGRTDPVMRAWREWRQRHANMAVTLVRGNHDDHAGDPPPDAGIELADEPWLLGPFACCHHPAGHPTHFVLAGHLHPVCHLHGNAHDRLRLPCFVNDEHSAILPAFGAFTGGHAIPPAKGRRFHVIGGHHRVWTLPAQAVVNASTP